MRITYTSLQLDGTTRNCIYLHGNTQFSVWTKPRRGEKFSGGEFLGRGIFPRQFGRGGFGGENLKIFPAGGGMARIL